jgi:hypothetical protein
MNDTTQFNMRISKSLVNDIERIAQSLNMNRNDWLRYEIAQVIKSEKEKLIKKVEWQFIGGRINAEEFAQQLGHKPSKQLLKFKKKVAEAPHRYFNDIINNLK